MDPFDIFPQMILEHIDALKEGTLHKGRFIGMYMEKINNFPSLPEHSSFFKYPQFVSKQSSDRSNNWLDFILGMETEEFNQFKRGLNS